MVGPKKQGFWPKINILDGNHCILRIREAHVSKKLDMILENKVFQKLTNWRSPYSQNTMVSFEYIDFWPKTLLFKTHHLQSSTTELILMSLPF